MMITEKAPVYGLSGNALKILAAGFMVVDHIGYLFFPDMQILRILGRIAFPVFAYMIAQGCRYTRNKWKYLGSIAALAFLCQMVYYLYDGSTFMCVLVTFTVSIVLTYAMTAWKESMWDKSCSILQKGLYFLLWMLTIGIVYGLNQVLTIDYGFWGCMTPMVISLFQPTGKYPEKLSAFDRNIVHVGMMAFALVFLGKQMGGMQMYALLSVPLLLLYSGKRGAWNLKYFFYIFYPLHLVLLQGIQTLLLGR